MNSGTSDEPDDERIPGIQYYKGIPIFPFMPDSIRESTFYNIEAGDLSTESDVNELMRTMWEHPSSQYYYYYGHNGGPSADGAWQAARRFGLIEIVETERKFYKHPDGQNDFVKIETGEDGKFNWDWEKEVVDTGPEYWRATLRLSPRKKEEFDTWRKVQLEEDFRKKVMQSQYESDVFLSYASEDGKEADFVRTKLERAGFRVFMAGKVLRPGDDFAEQIRRALIGAKELWLLVSPNSKLSEWVTTEWGAAWVLQKRIVPILHRHSPEDLPPRIAKVHCLDLHQVQEHIDELVRERDKSK